MQQLPSDNKGGSNARQCMLLVPSGRCVYVGKWSMLQHQPGRCRQCLIPPAECRAAAAAPCKPPAAPALPAQQPYEQLALPGFCLTAQQLQQTAAAQHLHEATAAPINQQQQQLHHHRAMCPPPQTGDVQLLQQGLQQKACKQVQPPARTAIGARGCLPSKMRLPPLLRYTASAGCSQTLLGYPPLSSFLSVCLRHGRNHRSRAHQCACDCSYHRFQSAHVLCSIAYAAVQLLAANGWPYIAEAQHSTGCV